MSLKRITYILIISLIASFAIRVSGTLFPHVFQNAYVVKGTIIAHTFFMLVHCLFFVWFLREYTAGRHQILRTGSVLAIIGSFSVALIYLKNLCHVFQLDILPVFCMSYYFDAFVPLVSSLFHLAFFGIFKKVQSQEEYEFLDRSILSAIIGVMIFMVLHLVVLINFLKFQKFNWLEHMPRMIAVVTVPLTAAAAILILYFYIKFYQFLLLPSSRT